MKKNIKKILGAVSFAAILPAMSFVGCAYTGGKNEGKNGSISVSIRSSDYAIWKKISDAFEKATGIAINLTGGDIDQSAYEAKVLANSIDDLSITPTPLAQKGWEKGWFSPIDVYDVMTNKKYVESFDNSKLVDKYKKFREDKTIKFIDKNFDINQYKAISLPIDKRGEYIHNNPNAKNLDFLDYNFPVLKSASFRLFWKKFPRITDSDGIHPSIYDPNRDLKWYVANGMGGIQEIESSEFEKRFNGESPLRKILPNGEYKGDIFKLSKDDINEFLQQSGRKSSRKFNLGGGDHDLSTLNFNSSVNNKPLYGDSPLNMVISTGRIGNQQRIFAVQKVIQKRGDDLLNKAGYKGKNFLLPGSQKFSFIGFNADKFGEGLSAILPNGNGAAHLTSDGLINDGELFSQLFQQDSWKSGMWSKANTTKIIPKMDDQKYPQQGLTESIILYYLASSLIRPTHKNEGSIDGSMDGGWTPFDDYPLWKFNTELKSITSHNGLVKKWTSNDELLRTTFDISQASMTGSSMDGYSVKRNISEKQLNKVKTLLRFLSQKEVSKMIVNGNALPLNRLAASELKNKDNLWKQMIGKSIDEIYNDDKLTYKYNTTTNNVVGGKGPLKQELEYIYSGTKGGTKGIYDSFNGLSSYDYTLPKGWNYGSYVTMKEYLEGLDGLLDTFSDKLVLGGIKIPKF